ncbi:MAG: hypothetical protein AB4062_15580 [Crocosphaera sp.]
MSQEAIKTINRFLNILETDTELSPESLQTLPEISEQLNQLELDQLNENKAFFNISKIILQWSQNYPQVQAFLRQDPNEKIKPKNRPKSNDKDLTIVNQFQTPREAIEILKKEIEKSQNNPPQQS